MRLQPRALEAAVIVRGMISCGDLPAGALAPTITQLHEMTGISWHNCFRALGELEREGTLLRQGKRRAVAAARAAV